MNKLYLHNHSVVQVFLLLAILDSCEWTKEGILIGQENERLYNNQIE